MDWGTFLTWLLQAMIVLTVLLLVAAFVSVIRESGKGK